MAKSRSRRPRGSEASFRGSRKKVSLPRGNDNHKMMAMLSYLSMLVVIPLVWGGKNKSVKFHSRQGFVLLVAEFLTVVVAAVIPVLGTIVAALAWLVWLVLSVWGLVNVALNKEKPLPLVGKYARILG